MSLINEHIFRAELGEVTPHSLDVAMRHAAKPIPIDAFPGGLGQGLGPLDEGIRLRGHAVLGLLRGDGTGLIVSQPNLITNAGFDLICDVLGKNAQPGDLTHIGIGTGAVAAAAADAALGAQTARVAADYAHNAGTKEMTLTTTVAAGTGTGDITEAGTFNAAAGGVMFNRTVFAAIQKAATDTLRVQFTFTFA